MIVVTAGTSAFRKIIAAQARKCNEFGYQHKIYDLGGLGFGERYKVDPNKLIRTKSRQQGFSCDFKAVLVLKDAQPGQAICWMDGDCLPLLPFEPEGDWDAAVTMRSANEVGRSGRPRTMFLNSGVVFVRNMGFAVTWRELTVAADNCQIALNNAALPEKTIAACRGIIGKTIESPTGFKVKILDAIEWNCWHIPPPPGARILHFKSDRRNLAEKYL